ncbi:response regulator transcription factor [Hydrogenimonas cancrithermarum]|uniref:DNA-binding response regulator n=1 Tax=Hydrogenimonas cancrithermarum TaxID=2993563 RepID=A0ABN6WYM8_9BACT|nr:response regulator transcription factor [Hydrogenimonas cancrithermarum]BDY13337.1 DNA-binding response regulator [Hydrogenimonas cancrithermarum]
MINILMIEDDIDISSLLAKFLAQYGMNVQCVETPKAALNALQLDQYDLIILDLTLPQMDGLELCKLIRKDYDIPIIISSARSDLTDKIIGLEYGADDYLPKPYEPRELVARIQTVLRRYRPTLRNEGSDFELNEGKMQIRFKGELLDLTTAEYEILRLLLLNAGTVLSRDYLANNAESISWESSERTIDVIISRVRNKIGDNPKQPRYIHSIRGAGYKFTP